MRNSSNSNAHDKSPDINNKLSIQQDEVVSVPSPSKSFKLRNNQVQTISNGHIPKVAQPPTTIENSVLLQPEPTEYKKVCNGRVCRAFP